ncbi:bifunctional DNA-formamidopyrimidine glycosylase/DNA-(apurinic or apyrimidinic site) lyase [Fodinicurvata sp. EGI_FJ10296]|uniref:bifunctional DNA-formamidopyrimidine glycosylase/DNA-(apurinic or apyrimidinic site) lyase n=1 Tax=Fodinicurvata sp. EGI_FJ10296 TaxID=3231908 RepID=UPI0034543A0F
MPELPEVETVRRGLAPVVSGARIVDARIGRPDLRYPLPPDLGRRLAGSVVERADRRAKYLLLPLDSGWTVIWHLGMSGRVLIHLPDVPLPAPRTHDHIVLRFDNGAVVTFNDPRRFGMMDLAAPGTLAENRHLCRLGPEPLDHGFTGASLARSLSGRRGPIKAVLLDQSVVAGLGNIYVCEALYRARISPFRSAGSVSARGAARLASAIKAVLAEAIDAGGSTLRDYVRTSGELGYFQHGFAVYDRAGKACPDCTCDPAETGGIVRTVQSNRGTFYCPVRQR